MSKLGIVILVFVGRSACAPVAAQVSNVTQNPQMEQLDADGLARNVFHNEVQAEIHDQSLWCYRQLKEEEGKKRILAVCQTMDGEIDRLLEVNGQELNPSQRKAEDEHLQKMVNNPGFMHQENKKRQEDARQTLDLMRMFPEAFRFQYEGRQGNLIKLRFEPNPGFHPSGRPAQVFHHMEGDLLVDGEQQRLVEMDGQLTSEVKFGWGLFGHLDKGGTFLVKQRDLGSGHWELTMLDVQMAGKALFFKTIAVREKESDTDFRRVPDDMSPRQALELLMQEAAFEKCCGGNL